jgi:hypothetical protein
VDSGAVRAKVAGKAPTLVLVKPELGLCGGCAVGPQEATGVVSDPAGASFVFSMEPKVERFASVDNDWALCRCCVFGVGCLVICSDGTSRRKKNTCAVPSGWASSERSFTRFEIWHVVQ